MKNIQLIFAMCFCLMIQNLAFSQVIRKKVGEDWKNIYSIEENMVYIKKNDKWVKMFLIEGNVIKFYKNGNWINQYRIVETTIQEAIDGKWMNAYYIKDGYLIYKKNRDGNFYEEWRVKERDIQYKNYLKWETRYYCFDNVENLPLRVCVLDADNYKVNQPAADGQLVNTTVTHSGNSERPSSNLNRGNHTTTAASSTASRNNKNNGCTKPQLSNSEFSETLRALKNQGFDDDRVELAKQIATSNCLSSSQVKQMMAEMSFDKNRLELAKYAYKYVYDPNKYHLLSDGFDFSSNASALNKYILSLN